MSHEKFNHEGGFFLPTFFFQITAPVNVNWLCMMLRLLFQSYMAEKNDRDILTDDLYKLGVKYGLTKIEDFLKSQTGHGIK